MKVQVLRLFSSTVHVVEDEDARTKIGTLSGIQNSNSIRERGVMGTHETRYRTVTSRS
jgi:hypothetical protein